MNKRNIQGINISAGHSCFTRCLGCYNHFGSKILETDNIITFLKYLKCETEIRKVTLCGGDPLSRPDILFLIEEIKKLGFYVSVDTMGTNLLSDVKTIFHGNKIIPKIDAAILSKIVDIIGIPIEAATNETFLTFRTGRPNILNEVLEILKILDQNHAKICINTVVHKFNYSEIEKILHLIAPFKSIVKWQLFQFMPIGPLGFKNREKYTIDDSSFQTLENIISELAKKTSFSGSVQFKSRTYRKRKYLLIDSDGNAWTPRFSEVEYWMEDFDTSDQRIILGNIYNKEDFPKILSYYLEVNHHEECLV